MRYFSTNGSSKSVDLCEAVTRSFATDGGVYMPLSIPLIPNALFKNIEAMSITDIAYVVASTLFGSDIDLPLINDIVKDTINFDIPVVKLSDRIYSMELFHGPTHTFKDVGARFMARVIEYFRKQGKLPAGPINLLVATQGDTGYAVAEAFADMTDVKVFIFHPADRHLRVPEHIMHSIARNVVAVEVRGTLDDCQELVRRAYEDEQLNNKLNLTSANSINIARLLPQTFFYFYAYARMKAMGERTDKIVISMPCENLGNLTAALFAKQMGLPVKRIMAAGRGHERLWGEMQDGVLEVSHFNQRALSTNLARINSLIQHNPSLSSAVDCFTYNYEEIAEQISMTYSASHYLMDRNTAMACRALTEHLEEDEVGVFLATAHPEMYADKLHEILGINFISDTSRRQSFKDRAAPLSPTLPAVRHFLLENSK